MTVETGEASWIRDALASRIVASRVRWLWEASPLPTGTHVRRLLSLGPSGGARLIGESDCGTHFGSWAGRYFRPPSWKAIREGWASFQFTPRQG